MTTIYSGTVSHKDGTRTAYYTDVLDTLPPDIRGFCARSVDALIRETLRGEGD